MLRLIGLIISKVRRALASEDDARVIIQPLSLSKLEIEAECHWDVFTEEILPRLPAKQLQTLKIVCKNWYRIISSPCFVQLQLNMYNESRMRVLVPMQNDTIAEYNINSCVEETKRIPYPPPGIGHRAPCPTILGSCDGLICLYLRGTGPTIAMFNPSTGKSFWVQSPLKDCFYVSRSWFGHHPRSGERVLVLGSSDEDEVGVYKFDNGGYSLKKIHSTSCISSRCHEQGVGTLVHGALHWPVFKWIESGYNSGCGFRQHVISAYHIDDNKCSEISPPLEGCHFELGVVDKCLFAILKPTINSQVAREFEMWIMKEYGVTQSWTKYANIDSGELYHTTLSPLGFFPNGDLILDVDQCNLIKYSFNDKKHALLMNHVFGVPIMCADSLVSPEIVGTSLQ